MRKELREKVKKMSDLELIQYVQDFNKPEKEEFYSEDFRKAAHEEICRRGKKKLKRSLTN